MVDNSLASLKGSKGVPIILWNFITVSPSKGQVGVSIRPAFPGAGEQGRRDGPVCRTETLRSRHKLPRRSSSQSSQLGDRHCRDGDADVGMGPPGSGKTVVLDRCIRRAVRSSARVLVALPTGAQRARM
eukprot:2881438-Amphidinium_carterae.1